MAGNFLNAASTTDWTGTLPTYWAPAVIELADRFSISGRFAGPEGGNTPIIEQYDLTKRPGQTLTFTVVGRLLGAGVSGTTQLRNSEELIPTSTFSVTITHNRHATAWNELVVVQSIVQAVKTATRLFMDKNSGWLTRRFDDDWMTQHLNTDTIDTIYAGSKTSRANLGPGDTFLPRELTRLHTRARRIGVQPFQQTRFGPLPWPIYAVCMSDIDYYLLSTDATFHDDMKFAAARGMDNPALTGIANMYQSCLIYIVGSVAPGDGYLGSFLRPEARLAATMTATQTTMTIGPATAVTNVDYGKYFPDTGTLNVLLVESEQMTYTGSATNPGNSSWATIVRNANGTAAATHASGLNVTLKNLGKVMLVGSNALMRAWGLRPEQIRDDQDYQFERGLGVKWFYGLKAVLRPDSTELNAAAMETYAPAANI